MTTDEIMAMAREAGLLPDNAHPAPETRAMRKRCEVVKRFAALVEAKEREACAQVCDHYAHAKDYGGNTYMRSEDCKNAATAIRARRAQ